MEKITTLILFVIAMTFFGCDQQDADPTPEKKIRAEKVQHGEYSYRVLTYNDKDKVSSITTGLIEDGDTAEVTYDVIYVGTRVDKIHIQDGCEIRYVYEGNLITESHQYIGDDIEQSNLYEYDGSGHVISYITKRNSDGVGFGPIIKQEYAYNDQDNLIESKYYFYDTTQKEYQLSSTTVYEDFDDKRNSNHLFWTNLYNLNFIPFKNNPGVWRVTNENGSMGEERVHYEYNELGYVTRQISETGGYPIEYVFAEY